MSNYLFVDDEFAQLQTAADILGNLMKKIFLDDTRGNSERKTERKKLKKLSKSSGEKTLQQVSHNDNNNNNVSNNNNSKRIFLDLTSNLRDV